MSKKKLALLTLSLVLVATIGAGATLAYFTDSDAATNVITMGHVDIDLDEPNYDPDDPNTPEDEGEDNTITDIVPGEVITEDPTITVAQGSADAYLRASITLGDNLSEQQAAELLEGIVINDGWVLAEDGYYYYQSVVKEGESAVLFNEVTIPAAWGNEVADMTITIDVAAEAIQADNFEPEMADGVIVGWNDVTAETYGEAVEE